MPDEPLVATPRPPLRERKQQETRERIVAAAYRLFEQRGYTRVTVDDIADAAEIGRATFFRYFGDKQEVVFAAEPTIRQDLSAEMSSREQVPATLAACVSLLREIALPLWRQTEASPHHALHLRLVHENAELNDRRLRKLLSFTTEVTELLVRRGVERGLARLATQLVAACYLAAEDAKVDNIDANLTTLLRDLRA
ncbi:TetR/AcrR family transcriptional regulator [Amycolatopsis sp. NPDC098790]|uniref:TetR/AcrR family transcriptional regulator n=1 Tax=Amycolatopsis sp. NPDC098790 TaxID=3363939 RepID=UPI0038266826